MFGRGALYPIERRHDGKRDRRQPVRNGGIAGKRNSHNGAQRRHDVHGLRNLI
jgi:hypothetical protein